MRKSRYFKSEELDEEFREGFRRETARASRRGVVLESSGLGDVTAEERIERLPGAGAGSAGVRSRESSGEEELVVARAKSKGRRRMRVLEDSDSELEENTREPAAIANRAGAGASSRAIASAGASSRARASARAVEYAKGEELNSSIIKVYTAGRSYDFAEPHLKSSSVSWTGSGFVIEFQGQLVVLTNAHVASDYKNIRLRKANSSTRYTARAVNIMNECDLAMLVVDDPTFFNGVKPIEISTDMHLLPGREEVSVKGFPLGGAELSESYGKVNRIEVETYVQGMQELLQVQVDAPINPGNSGGPVFVGDKLVGVAFQGISGGDGLGYIIPLQIVQLFLEHCLKQDPSMRGFPILAADVQHVENPVQRAALGMTDDLTGVMVTSVPKLSSAKGKLQDRDVITAVNGYKVNNDGTIDYPWRSHVDFTHEFSTMHLGDKVHVRVLRDKELVDVEFRLTNKFSDTLRVKPIRYNRAPTYLVESGMMFSPVMQNNIDCIEDETFRGKSVDLASKDEITDEIVYVSKVLECDDTLGYAVAENHVLHSVNGVKINNMVQLKNVLDAIEAGGAIEFNLANGFIAYMNKFDSSKARDVALQNDMTPDEQCSADLTDELIQHYFAMDQDPRARVLGDSFVIGSSYERHRTSLVDFGVSAEVLRVFGASSSPRPSAVASLALRADAESASSRGGASARADMESDSESDDEDFEASASERSGASAEDEDEDVAPAPRARVLALGRKRRRSTGAAATSSKAKRRRPVESEEKSAGEECDSMDEFIVSDGEDYRGLDAIDPGALGAVRSLSLAHRGRFQQRLAQRMEEEEDEFDEEVNGESARKAPKARRKRKARMG